MPHTPRIHLNHLCYTIPDIPVSFQNLSLQFEQQRYGIIGDNGMGKTTLLKLMAGNIAPQQGTVQIAGTLQWLQQNRVTANVTETVLDALGVSEKVHALWRISAGTAHENDVELVGEDWDILEQCQKWFQHFELNHIKFDTFFSSLSGGQKTLCQLVGVILKKADFILLDEPTNNLDLGARNKLYHWMQQSQQGMLIVSHDRNLLNLMDEIIEITSKGINRYGGNYEFYQAQKMLQQQALTQQLLTAKRQANQTKQTIQQTYERHQKKAKRGHTLRTQGKIDKVTANSKKGRSERSQSRNKIQAEQMLAQSAEALAAIQAKVEIKEAIHANLSATHVPKGKMVLEIEDLSFNYTGQPNLLEQFNLCITGPERVAIAGKNGSGKTTLIQLILRKLQPTKGIIKCGVNAICYLDQKVDFLEPNLSIVDNFQHCNPDLNIRDIYFALASFNFRNKDAEKRVENLSGGERMRAGLAISLLAKVPPQLIILDEPTNHLDIHSIEAIEMALNQYAGALLVISHDNQFLTNINVTRIIEMIS